MSALLASAVLAAGSVVATILAAGRLRRGQDAGEPRPTEVPWLLAVARALAHPVAACVAPLLGTRRIARLTSTLESLGLHPYFTATTWFATRLVLALAAGAAALGLALLSEHGRSWIAPVAMGSAWFGTRQWLGRRRARLELDVLRELPAYLDLLTVCVEAGATLTAGVRLIVAQAPGGPVRAYFDRVLREVRGGRPRAAAFLHVAESFAVESLVTMAGALAQAESSGMSLGQVLRAQSAQRTSERFARAERLAMQAPVKMLGPLILCIFPCTFIVLAVPIAVRLREVLLP